VLHDRFRLPANTAKLATHPYQQRKIAQRLTLAGKAV
jgi:hypothetical protein